MIKRVVLSTLLGVAVLCISPGFAQQKPVQNISGKKHPNLAAAQHLTEQAYQKILAAQRDNEYDMAGHAKKAEQLLDQANEELKQAATAANKNAK